MVSDNSTENIFRFMQLRAAQPISDGVPEDLSLNDKTPLALHLSLRNITKQKRLQTLSSTSLISPS